jgi:LPXTG-site transpeptidase (sortase) family protein
LDHQVRTRRLGSLFVCIGVCLVVSVVGMYALGRVDAWLLAQPRVRVDDRVVWPVVPPTQIPFSTPLPTPTPVPTPRVVPAPPVRIEIPSLGVERAIVPLGMVTVGGRLEWDSESLFATANRRDLVGHMEGSANPGEVGNVVLAGHNYNRGAYNWTGVFVSLSRLKPGDTVRIVNERDEGFLYEVQWVEEVPFSRRTHANLLTHIDYLAPTPQETLTLTTCGGGGRAPFPNRVYVVARRAG